VTFLEDSTRRRRDCSRVLTLCIQATSLEGAQGVLWWVAMSLPPKCFFFPTHTSRGSRHHATFGGKSGTPAILVAVARPKARYEQVPTRLTRKTTIANATALLTSRPVMEDAFVRTKSTKRSKTGAIATESANLRLRGGDSRPSRQQKHVPMSKSSCKHVTSSQEHVASHLGIAARLRLWQDNVRLLA